MKASRPTIFLDTSALITLVNEMRPHHAAMVAFYDAWTREDANVKVVLSAIVVAEYEAMADFPQQLQFYFDVESFGHKAAETAGRLRRKWDVAYGNPKTEDATRTQIKDDFKIVAHAVSEGAAVIITEDASSLARYVDFANKSGLSKMFAWTLGKGFDTQVAKGELPDLMSNQA